MKYYYAFYKDTENKPCHQFTTCKDSLSPEALYITSITTDYCNKLWSLVERYAIQSGESVSIENDVQYKEWYKGTLWCEAHKSNDRWFYSSESE